MSHDLVRQTTTTMAPPFVLALDAGFDTFASRYAVGAPIFVGLQGRDASGAPVAQRCVGVGQLLIDGKLQVDSVSAGSDGAALPAFSCDSIVVVDVMSVAALNALVVAGTASSEKLANKDQPNGYAGRDGDGGILLPTVVAPTVPAAGNVKLFGRELATRMMAAIVGPSGLDVTLQPFLGRNKVGQWSAVGNTVTTPITAFGLALPTILSTATARTVVAGSTCLAAMRRIGYVSAATAAAVCGWRLAVGQFFRGSTPLAGGFFHVLRFGLSDVVFGPGTRTFAGMMAQVTAPGDVNPSARANILGVGHDDGDANWQVMHNDATGTATKVDTGIPVNATDALELIVFAPPAGSGVGFRFTNLETGAFFAAVVSNDIPLPTQLLTMNCVRTTAATTASVGIDLVTAYIETDF